MNFDNLHQILRSLYEQMMPLCGDMAGVAKGIAGLGALTRAVQSEREASDGPTGKLVRARTTG